MRNNGKNKDPKIAFYELLKGVQKLPINHWSHVAPELASLLKMFLCIH